MKPVLLGRIAMITSVIFPFLGGNTWVSMVLFALPQAALLYSLYQIGNAYDKKGIFTNYLISVILSVICTVVFPYLFQQEVVKIGQKFLEAAPTDTTKIMQQLAEMMKDQRVAEDVLMFAINKTQILAYLMAFLGVYFVCLLFTRLAFVKLGKASGVELFKTGSLVIMIGFPGILLFGLGMLAMVIGFVMLIIGFFTLTDAQVAEAQDTRS